MPVREPMITTDEATRLIEMLKKSTAAAISFPSSGRNKEFEVYGETKRDIFIVNIFRGKIEVSKCNINGRTKAGNTMLLKLHLGDTLKHRNPDGEIIIGSHLHVYCQEYGCDVATRFDTSDTSIVENCIAFMDRFHIIKKPEILYQAELM